MSAVAWPWPWLILWTLAVLVIGAIARDKYVHRRAQRLVRKLKFEQMKARCSSCRHYNQPCDIHKKELR
jgi:hypothetical protein